MADEDQEQKTEQPTQKRLDEAAKRGQIPFSREVSSFFILFVLTMIVSVFLPGMLQKAKLTLMPFIVNADQLATDPQGLAKAMKDLLAGSFMVLLFPFFASIVAALAAGILQTGFKFSAESITPKFSKISPMAGFKRLFSKRSLVEFLKGLIKLTIVGILCWMSIKSYLPELKQLPSRDVLGLLLFMAKVCSKLMIWVCVTMFFIALFDTLYQRFEHIKSLRMTKQEIKDEYKQQEGDPHIKQRLRKLRMEKAQKRMMSAVPDADVVITNPTHYAVVLKYETGKMEAPKVVAKGLDYIALNIRKVAEEHKVTIVENPPLARALYAAVEIDQEIPFEHYQAVAEIISYVYKIKGKLPKGGNK